MSTVDNFIALKVLYMLVTPFEKTQAFKLGVIDKDGTLLVKIKDQSPAQKESYTYLDRLVFNLKRLISKVPGGQSQIASIVAALYLIKEKREDKLSPAKLELEFNTMLRRLEHVTLVEEQIMVEKFMKLYEEGEAPANVTGAGVSTDTTVVKKKDLSKIFRRRKKQNGVPTA